LCGILYTRELITHNGKIYLSKCEKRYKESRLINKTVSDLEIEQLNYLAQKQAKENVSLVLAVQQNR
jgi:hypothetical protein